MSLLDLHIKQRNAILYVGTAGTRKTTIFKNYFFIVDKETTVADTINFNSFTDSKDLQVVIDLILQKI